MEYSHVFVVLMGLGIVFFGLICLIVLTMIMGAVLERGGHKNEAGIKGGSPAAKQSTSLATSGSAAVPAQAPSINAASAQSAPQALDRAVVAAMAAGIAEQLGVDVLGIKILSIRRV